MCISVGHRKGAQGAAYSADGAAPMTEWLYNMALAPRLAEALQARGLEVAIVERPNRAVYRGTGDDRRRVGPYMRQVEAVAATKALLAIDLHLNAARSVWARGRLILSSGSRGSLELCGALRGAMGQAFPNSQDRGVEVRSVEQNGGPFLHLPPMPCALLEPWFISNADDRHDLVWYQEEYVAALVEGIMNYLSAIGALD